jgi:predicted metal-dependent hydrolase
VIVRAPLRASEANLVRLVSQKESWIKRKQAQVRRQYPGVPAKQFINGEPFYYLGEQYELLIVDRTRPQLLLNERFELSREALTYAEEVFTGWYREAARRVISERATLIAGDNNLQFDRIRITSARTRWGSCNSRGGLNFTWRLAMAPLPVIDRLSPALRLVETQRLHVDLNLTPG